MSEYDDYIYGLLHWYETPDFNKRDNPFEEIEEEATLEDAKRKIEILGAIEIWFQ